MNRLIQGVSLMLAIWIAGCGTAPEPMKSDSEIAFSDYPQITPLETLHRKLKLSKVIEEPGPPVKVTVVVRHDESDDIRHVQYRYFFINSDGVPEDENPDWRYLQIEPRVLAYLSGNGLSDKSTQWRLEIRPDR